MKKTIQFILPVMILLLGSHTFAQDKLIGKWNTIDDNSGKKRSVVEIYNKDGKLYGKVLQLFREPGEEANPVCDECDSDDPRYNQPVIGMVIMEGLEKVSDKKYDDGEILDPENGNVYSCYIELQSDGRLKLRGYLGVALLGRTQYWVRP